MPSADDTQPEDSRIWKRGPRNGGKTGTSGKLKEPQAYKLGNFRLPVKVWEDLRVLSETDGLTMREHAETALKRYINKRKRRDFLAKQRNV